MTGEIAPGVWQVPTTRGARDNAFLVAGDDGLTLVDVGWAGAPKVLLAAFTELGHTPRDLRRIVITHAHPDHVRGLAEFRTHIDASVLIHGADAGWLRAGRVPSGGRSGRLGTLLDTVPLLHWTPVEPDGELLDDQLIEGSGGLRVIHTPGHSPGHVVLLHEPSRTLLTGDAVFHRGGAPGQGPDVLSHDPAARDESLAKLPIDVGTVGFAHGTPLTGTGVTAYQQWLSGRTE